MDTWYGVSSPPLLEPQCWKTDFFIHASKSYFPKYSSTEAEISPPWDTPISPGYPQCIYRRWTELTVKSSIKIPSSVLFGLGLGSYLRGRHVENGSMSVLRLTRYHLLSAKITVRRVSAVAEIRPEPVSGPRALGQNLPAGFSTGIL